MTDTQWRQRVRDRRGDHCNARRHAPGCTMLGVHVHHIVFRSASPSFTHATVIENGLPLSDACHTLAHGAPKNGNLDPNDVRIAEEAIAAAIARSHKSHLRVKRHERCS